MLAVPEFELQQFYRTAAIPPSSCTRHRLNETRLYIAANRPNAGCYVDPRTVPTIELHDDEGIEPMVGTINKSLAATSGALGKCPSLAGWPSPLDHVFGDARLRDLKPELEQSL